MSSRIHIADMEMPYEARASVTTRCRKEISKPDFAFMWDEQAMGEQVSFPINACRKCLRAPEVSLRYVYGVREL